MTSPPPPVSPPKLKAYTRVEEAFAKAELDEELVQLSDAQREQLRVYWVDRADGELTTALAFEFMLDDLRALEAPTALCQLAERAIAEEHHHTDWCLRWARRVAPEVPAKASLRGVRPMTLAGASDHDNRLLRTVFGGCFSETVALHVLRASHAEISIPSVRYLNHLHLKEEVDHARLGWQLLTWSAAKERDRQMLAEYVPELVQLTRTVWQSTPRASDPKLHAFGFLSSAIVDPALEQALSEVTLPGLQHLGVLK